MSKETSTVTPKKRPPYPVITPETEPFWGSINDHAMRLPRCNAGDGFFFPPANFCPTCWGTDVSFELVAGTGHIFSFVTFRRLYNPAFAELLPYAVAVIELDEGPRLLSRIVGAGDDEGLAIGAAVHVVYEPLDETTTLPLFALDEQAEQGSANVKSDDVH